MSAMIDVSCPKCGRRFGWCGEMRDRPPCPKCGHQLPADQLNKSQSSFDEGRELLAEANALLVTKKQGGNVNCLHALRVSDGLTLRQAAKLLGIFPSLISDLEFGRTELSAELAQKMGRLYGGD